MIKKMKMHLYNKITGKMLLKEGRRKNNEKGTKEKKKR